MRLVMRGRRRRARYAEPALDLILVSRHPQEGISGQRFAIRDSRVRAPGARFENRVTSRQSQID